MNTIRYRAPLAAAIVLLCLCLIGTAGAAQPAVTVTTPGPDLATEPVTPTAPPTPQASSPPGGEANTSVPTPTPTAALPTPAPTPSGPLTLVLEMPRSPALWGDVVRCTGSGASETLRVLVDGVEAGQASPDAGGAYRFEYLVDRIQAGAHVVSAASGNRSAEASLEVASTVPVVLLDALPSTWQNGPALLCTGNVTASGIGVPNAPVHLVFDRFGWADATTGPSGQFEVRAGIQGGKHEVVANVSFDDGRPLGPAVSGVVTAVVPGGSLLPSLPPWALAAIAVLVVVLIGGGIFVRRRRSRKEPGEPLPRDVDLAALFQPAASAAPTAAAAETAPAPPVAPPVVPAEPTAVEPPAAAPPAAPPVEAALPANAAEAPGVVGVVDLRSAAWGLAGNGMRCGIGAVYSDLVARLAAREPDAHLEGMTPRQLAAHFAGTPTGVAVARVAACYEAVTSTWRPPTPADLEVMVEGYVAALAEAGSSGQ